MSRKRKVRGSVSWQECDCKCAMLDHGMYLKCFRCGFLHRTDGDNDTLRLRIMRELDHPATR